MGHEEEVLKKAKAVKKEGGLRADHLAGRFYVWTKR